MLLPHASLNLKSEDVFTAAELNWTELHLWTGCEHKGPELVEQFSCTTTLISLSANQVVTLTRVTNQRVVTVA